LRRNSFADPKSFSPRRPLFGCVGESSLAEEVGDDVSGRRSKRLRRGGFNMATRLTAGAFESNGVAETAKPLRKPRSRKAATVPEAGPPAPVAADAASRWRRPITVGVGCGIPGLSLALSSIGGRLLVAGHSGLGVAALGLCCSVLAVPLSHLAWAIRDITRSA
jgi:hypothetical protein